MFPSYTVPYAGYRKFVANLNVNVEFPTAGQEVTYSFTARAGSRVVGGPIVQSFGSVQTSGTQTYGQITCSRNISNIVTSSISPSSAVTNYGPFLVKTVGGGQSGPSNAGDFITTVYLDLLQYLDTGTGETITLNGVKVATAYSSGDPVLSNNIYKINDPSNPKTVTELGQITNYSIEPPTNVLTANLNLNLDTDLDNYIANEQVTFELQENVKTTATTFAGNYTASVSVGSLQVVESVVQGSYPFATNDSAPYISGFNNSGIYGYVTMSTDLSLFYGYQQVPYFVSGGVTYSSSLYDRYGDVNVAFIPEPYDKLILTDRNGIVQNLDVYSVSNLSNGQLIIQTIPTITTSWVTNPALVETFLLLRRYNDEQNVILTYTKPPGQTSYGFILPETVNPLVTANINTLQAKVQAQLLSTQASATINTV